jgi:hypothetical protein
MPSYILKMHHFTKTGSGQTYIGKAALKKRPAFLQGFLRDNEDLDEADIAGKLIDYALQKAAVRVAAEIPEVRCHTRARARSRHECHLVPVI